MNKRITVKEFGERENKGKGHTAWINDGEDNYTKWCGSEEDAKKIIGELKADDTIIISYTVRDQWKNFTTFQMMKGSTEAPKAEHKKEQEQGEQEQADKKAEAEKLLRQHYIDCLKEARLVVHEAKEAGDTVEVTTPLTVAVFDKLATPRVYFMKELKW